MRRWRVYAALAASGRLDPEQLDSYCADGTLLAGHPEHVLPGIDFSTGSLGQGLSLASGARHWRRECSAPYAGRSH